MGAPTRREPWAAREPSVRYNRSVSSFVLQTWNCFGAAQDARGFFRWRGVPDAHRLEHPHVIERVSEADVVCLQEIFLGDAEDFFHGLGHEHKTRDHNRSTLWPLTFGGSGLGLASRFPLSESGIVPFSRPHAGPERLARKGMLHARVCVRSSPRVEIDVVTTHLQAGYDQKARAVRERQIRELRDLVDRLGSSDRAFVVCGDLNICGLQPSRERGEYASLVAAFDGFRDLGADEDHATFDPRPEANTLAYRFEKGGPRQRIDYVLFRPPRAGRVSAERCELVLDAPITADGAAPTYPSDHFGVRVTIAGLGAEQVERAGEGAGPLAARAAMAGSVAEGSSGMGEGAGAR